MKSLILALGLITSFSLSGYIKSTPTAAVKVNYIQLSDEQMAMISGKGCSGIDWFLALLAWASCGTTAELGAGVIACLTASAVTADCIDQLDANFDISGDPGTPCPNGGYPEEYSTCQQIGGHIVGQSQSSMRPNDICCEDQ